jgi:hypothetical protein
MRTPGQTRLGIQVLVHAIVAVWAAAVLCKVVALGHAPQIVLVQEFAVVALFAQRSHPMFADQRVEARRAVVFVWAVGTQGTVSL